MRRSRPFYTAKVRVSARGLDGAVLGVFALLVVLDRCLRVALTLRLTGSTRLASAGIDCSRAKAMLELPATSSDESTGSASLRGVHMMLSSFRCLTQCVMRACESALPT